MIPPRIDLAMLRGRDFSVLCILLLLSCDKTKHNAPTTRCSKSGFGHSTWGSVGWGEGVSGHEATNSRKGFEKSPKSLSLRLVRPSSRVFLTFGTMGSGRLFKTFCFGPQDSFSQGWRNPDNWVASYVQVAAFLRRSPFSEWISGP